LKTDDDIRFLRQVVDNAAFALVAPLCSYYGCHWHLSVPFSLIG
jgi:hypothetical protein